MAPFYINGSTGISGVDGSAATPALQGTDTNTGISFGSDVIIASTGGSERLRIDSSGRVGIGTTSPSRPLHVSSSGSEQVILTSTSGSLAGIFFEPNGTTYTPFFGATGNSLVSYTQGLERARIDSSGRLLVGTFTSPSSGFGQYAKLVVQGQPADATGGGNFSIQRGEAAAGGNITSGEGIGNISWNDNAGNTFGLISCEADANAGTNDYPGRLVFSTTRDGASSTTAALWLDSDQRLGLGAINSSDARAQITATGNGYNLYLDANATYAGLYRFIRFRINTAVTGSIESNGTTTTYAQTSDYRVKENLIPLAGAINRVNQLQPYRFNFISNPDLTVDGFIAHEVQSIVPEAIVGTKDEVDADGNPVHQGIDQSKLVPLLTAALQEALAEIESLKARVTALEP